MRPRAIQEVPGLDPQLSSFGRFKQFARMILAVPKAEADKENNRVVAKVKNGSRRNSGNEAKRGKNQNKADG
jgi:hypothetical protein